MSALTVETDHLFALQSQRAAMALWTAKERSHIHSRNVARRESPRLAIGLGLDLEVNSKTQFSLLGGDLHGIHAHSGEALIELIAAS